MEQGNDFFENDPEVLLVLNSAEIQRLSYEEAGRKLRANRSVSIIPFTKKSDHPIIQKLVEKGLIKQKSILVKNPFDENDFVEATDAQSVFAIRKFTHFSSFCCLLGAKEVNIERIDTVNRSKKNSYQIKGSLIEYRGKAPVTDSQLQKIISHTRLSDTFSGGIPQIEAAESFLREHYLWSDPTLLSLLEIRRITENPIKSRELVLNLSTEAKRAIDIVAGVVSSVKLSAIFKDFEGSYSRVIQETTEYRYVVKVNF